MAGLSRLTRVEAWRWIAGATFVAIAWMTVGELRRGVVPFGDNAIIEVRSRDVFSSHPPLVNMLSTVASDMSVRHPGPLLFDLLAVPVRLVAHGRGLFIGVAVLHGIVVWTIGRTARRFLGADGAAVVAATVAILVWSLGREILTDPWQPHVTLLCFVLLLVASWGFASGCDRASPAMVFAFSFVLQTHASYLVVAPAAVIGASVIRVFAAKRAPVVRGPIEFAIVLGVVLWVQPLIQQLFGHGRGNLGAVLDIATGPHAESTGFGEAIRISSVVLAQPPLFLRPGTFTRLPIVEGAAAQALRMGSPPARMGLFGATVCLVVLVAVVASLTSRARTRSDQTVVAGGWMIAILSLSALAFITKLPIDPIFGLMVHKVRWLWPLSAFIVAFIAVAVTRTFSSRADAGTSRPIALAAIAVGATSLVASLPGSHHDSSIADRFRSIVAFNVNVREQLPELEDPGTVYVPVEQATIIEAFVETSLIAELVERDVPVGLSLPLATAQFGDQYTLRGEAVLTMRVTVGPVSPDPDDVDVMYEGEIELSESDREVFFPASGTADIVARVTLEPFEPSDVP